MSTTRTGLVGAGTLECLLERGVHLVGQGVALVRAPDLDALDAAGDSTENGIRHVVFVFSFASRFSPLAS
jgi:hypothetical protein